MIEGSARARSRNRRISQRSMHLVGAAAILLGTQLPGCQQQDGGARSAAPSALSERHTSDQPSLPVSPPEAPKRWTDVGILGYYEKGLGRNLTYGDLERDISPLINAGIVRRSADTYEVIKEGAEIVGYDFPEGTNLRISAANVSLRRVRIRAGHWSKHRGALYFQNAAPGNARDGSPSTVVLEDSEISGGHFGIYPSFRGVRLLALRNVVLANTIDPLTGRADRADLDSADGIDWRGTHNQIDVEAMASVIERNWIGGFVNGGVGHHYDGIAVVSGGNIKVLANRIEGYGVTQTVGIRIVSDIAPIKNVWVEGNVVAGFGYSYGLGWGNPTHTPSGELTNVYFRRNFSEAGTYQSGPLTVKHVDKEGAPALFNYVSESNVCVPPPGSLTLAERWRSLSVEVLLKQCQMKF